MLTVKDAVQKAVEYVQDLESVLPTTSLRLEETEFDDASSEWQITLSFLEGNMFGFQRSYKRFRVDAETGDVKSMTIRSVAA